MSHLTPNPGFVIQYISIEFDVPVETLTSDARNSEHASVKHMCMWIIHAFGRTSYHGLAEIFGLNNIQTASYACKRVASRMTDEIGFSEFIHQLKSVIEAEYQGNCRPAARGTYRRRFDLIDGRRRAKKRPCLRCQKTFISEHPGNRICEPCRRVNANVPLGMEMAV